MTAAPAGYGRVLDLVTRVRGVRGAMLVTGDDGLVVAEQLMEGIKGPAVAALAASLASRLRRALEAAGVGAGQFWHLQAEQGALLVVTAASGVLVVAVAEPDVNVGLVRLELLRHKGHLDAAHRVALTGLERHPHLADAHDLYARILADKHDFERAFDEWDMTLRIAPDHVGALKGLAFLYFKVGDVQQAAAHLEAAQRVAPDDPGIVQALALAHGGEAGPGAASPAPEPMAPAPAAQPLEEARVFAGLEGAEEGLLLLDPSGQVLGGALKDPAGRDVTDAVAAYLAGVSQEAGRTAKLLGLGRWTGLAAEGRHGHAHLTPPTGSALLLVVRERAVPMGRLAIIAQRAALAARRWLEAQG